LPAEGPGRFRWLSSGDGAPGCSHYWRNSMWNMLIVLADTSTDSHGSTEGHINTAINFLMLIVFWHQTYVFKQGNKIAERQAGTVQYPNHSLFKKYWPMMAMLGMLLLGWGLELHSAPFTGYSVLIVICISLIAIPALFIIAWRIIAENRAAHRAKSQRFVSPYRSPFSGPSEELIGDMYGNTPEVRLVDGIYEIREDGKLTSKRTFKPPIAFRVIAKTNTNNIRFEFIQEEIVLGWEMYKSDKILRLAKSGPFGSDRSVKGAGWIPADQWVTIDIFALPDRFAILVDDSERINEPVDLGAYNSRPFIVHQGFNSIVSVQSVTFGKPRDSI
jgi:hypothetical protein